MSKPKVFDIEEIRKDKFFQCVCRDMDHVVRLNYYLKEDETEPPELYVAIRINLWYNLVNRIRMAYNTVIKKYDKDLHCSVFSLKEATEMRDFINEFIKEYTPKKKTKKRT